MKLFQKEKRRILTNKKQKTERFYRFATLVNFQLLFGRPALKNFAIDIVLVSAIAGISQRTILRGIGMSAVSRPENPAADNLWRDRFQVVN